MPPTSAPEQSFHRSGYNPHAKEFRPAVPVTVETPPSPSRRRAHGPCDVFDTEHGPRLLPVPPPPPPPMGARGQGAHAAASRRADSQCGAILEVWKENVESAMADMAQLVADGYTVIGMDTEFPGVVLPPTGPGGLWATVRDNVNALRIIQLGLTFTDEDGRAPGDGRIGTFQVNFQFDLERDYFAEDSIAMLQDSGIDFDKLARRGVDVSHFAEVFTASGMVLNEEIKWVAFSAGYDFAYLMKLLTNSPLPAEEQEFLDLMRLYFPVVYDTKYMAKSCESVDWFSGLDHLAAILGAQRRGPAHQAGSDSLLTSSVFFALIEGHFSHQWLRQAEFANVVSGLGVDRSAGGAPQHMGWAPHAAAPRHFHERERGFHRHYQMQPVPCQA